MSGITEKKGIFNDILSLISVFLALFIMIMSVIYHRLDFYYALIFCVIIALTFNNVPEIIYISSELKREMIRKMSDKKSEDDKIVEAVICKNCDWKGDSGSNFCESCGAELS